MILFYDQLVDKHEVLLLIDKDDLPDNHKGQLKQLVDDIVHQGIIEFILQKLHPHQHDLFLERLHQAPYDPELLSFLKDHIHLDFEKDLKAEANRLVALIKKDLHQK